MIEIRQATAEEEPQEAAAAARAGDPRAPIRVEGLSKVYRNGVQAVRGVSLEVARGEVLCLLGPNGAGKTTLTRIVATQLAAGGGRVRVCGFDVEREARQVRRRIAVVPQESFPDPQLRVWEHVFYYLAARGMGWRRARGEAAGILGRLGLTDKRRELVQNLSGGMRRRVLLAMALGTGAEVMLLDEPTAGLDVLLRRELWQNLAETKRERTLLMTTHSMEEAEALADRIGIMGEGELVACGTVGELRALLPGGRKVVIDEGALPREDLERFGPLHRYAGKWAIFPADEAALYTLMQRAVAAGVEAAVLHPTLEDVFIHLVGDRRGTLKLGELR